MAAYRTTPGKLMEFGTYTFGRTVAYQIINVYAMKMAGVFMMSTCTLSLRTGIFPRWMAFLGYGPRYCFSSASGISTGLPWFSRCGCSS